MEEKNIYTFKEITLKLTKCKSHADFVDLSDAHLAFWEKLNTIGGRSINEFDSKTGLNANGENNVDIATKLSKTEWLKLIKELQSLIPKNT